MGDSSTRTPTKAELQRYAWSTPWRHFLKRYRESDRPQVCHVCGQEQVVLHHRTYERLGKERLDDVVPLCKSHHSETHALVDAGAATLWDAHTKLPKLAYPRSATPFSVNTRWRTSKNRGRHEKPEVRHVDPEEARAMVEAARARKRPVHGAVRPGA